MPRPEEIATIVAGGQQYRDWKAVEVRRDYGTIASVFRFSVAEVGTIGKGWSELKLRPGDPCQIHLAGRQVLDGKITVRQVAYDAQQHGVSLQGQSKPGPVTVGTVKPSEYKDYSYESIVGSLFKPYGVKLILKDAPKGSDKKFRVFRTIPGETVFEAVERLSRMRGLILTDDEKGNVIATRIGANQATVADLEEGRNIKVAQAVLQDQDAFTEISAVAQQPGNDQIHGTAARDVSATAKNPDVKGHKPLHLFAEMVGDKEDMRERVFQELAFNRAKMVDVSITVAGWLKDDGSLWIEHVGKNVRVKSPMIFPSSTITLAIKGVAHRQSSETGTETDIDLCLPMQLVNTQIGAMPQDKLNEAKPDASDEAT